MNSQEEPLDERRSSAIALHALAALDGEELASMKACEACPFSGMDRELAESRGLVALLSATSTTATAPPEGMQARLKQRLLREIEPPPVPHQGSAPGISHIRKHEGTWLPLPGKGVRMKELSNLPETGNVVFLLEVDPGGKLLDHRHSGIEQGFLLSGDLWANGEEFSAGDFFLAGAETHHHDLFSEHGCQALLITSTANYPAKAIHAFGRLHRLGSKLKSLLVK